MALKIIEKDFDGLRVFGNTQAARPAALLLVKIGQVLGGGLKSGSTIDLNNKAGLAAGVIGGILESADERKVDALIFDILRGLRASDGTETFDIFDEKGFNRAFTGEIAKLFEVLAWVISENYPDFFGEGSKLRGIIDGLKAKAEATEEKKTGSEE